MAAKTVIRPAAEADIPAILALYRQLDSALVAMQPEFFCEGPREEDEIRKAIRADDADFLLAERGGAVVGFALVGYAGWTPEFSCVLPHRYARLEDLAVDEAVRGEGVGGELLAAAKRWARNRRLEYLELNVLAQNENAIRLYESQDFVEATKVMRCMLLKPLCRGRACPARRFTVAPLSRLICRAGLDPFAGRRGRRPLQA